MNQFTDFQIKKLSSYFLTLSQLSIGSILLKFFEPGLELKIGIKLLLPVLAGALVALSCFWLGMRYAAKVKEVKD